MALPYDATTKDLFRYPADWLQRLHLEVHGPVEVIETDLSTVTATADKVLHIGEAQPWLLHLELQASRDLTLPRRLLKYNGLLHDHHELPVYSVVVLLRKEADDSALTGVIQYPSRPDLGGLDFRFRVVRVWEWSVEEVLSGGLGTLPLAPLSAQVTETELPAVIRRMEERLRTMDQAEEASRLWTSTLVLMGLRFSRELAAQLLQGVQGMKESVTYQMILEEGRAEGRAEGQAAALQNVIIRLGTPGLGAPGGKEEIAIRAVNDPDRLDRMLDRLSEVSNWQELLDTP
jgi:predicted transposase YdaD